jgi:hypothetical protein
MYRSVFDREIGTPPPSTVDVDRVIRRRRRSGRLRTVLAGTAAGLTAVAVVGVTGTALPDRDRGAARFGGPTEPVPSASATGDPVAARLEAALRGFLTATLPGAEFHGNRPPSAARFGPLVFEHRHREARAEVPGVSGGESGEDYYFATADIVTGAGTGNIAVGVGRREPDKLGIEAICPDEGALDAKTYSCTPSTGVAGERITIAKTTGTRAVQYRVEVVRTNGVAVFVQVTNNSRKGAQAELELDRADAADPPLTAGEARKLALLRTLTV